MTIIKMDPTQAAKEINTPTSENNATEEKKS
jgi:hypothetical protein